MSINDFLQMGSCAHSTGRFEAGQHVNRSTACQCRLNSIPSRGFPGAADARTFEQHGQVKTFTTEPLIQAVEWTGKVRAEASGSAPAMQGGGALGSPVRSTHAQLGDVQGGGEPQKAEPAQKPSLAGRILGFIGLIVAVLLLRGQSGRPTDERAAA